MKRTLGIAAIALMSFGLFGCNDTAAGMAEDTKENAAVVEKGAENMAEDVGEVAENASASTLTPRIKSALVANPITNDPKVSINVESTADMVTLNGHVTTQKQKDEAGEITKQILKEVGATQKFENKLEVTSDGS
jgi:osmotically-inducible protein OsmY